MLNRKKADTNVSAFFAAYLCALKTLKFLFDGEHKAWNRFIYT